MSEEWRPIREAPHDGRVLILLDGRRRFGCWDDQWAVWRSSVDPRVLLRPTHWRELPAPAPHDQK